MEYTINVDIESLAEGGIFEADELILHLTGESMVTLRREPESNEIRYLAYDILPGGQVRWNGGNELNPGDPYYQSYRTKLGEAQLW